MKTAAPCFLRKEMDYARLLLSSERSWGFAGVKIGWKSLAAHSSNHICFVQSNDSNRWISIFVKKPRKIGDKKPFALAVDSQATMRAFAILQTLSLPFAGRMANFDARKRKQWNDTKEDITHTHTLNNDAFDKNIPLSIFILNSIGLFYEVRVNPWGFFNAVVWVGTAMASRR